MPHVSRRDFMQAGAAGLLTSIRVPGPSAGPDLCFMPATEMVAAIRARKLSPVEAIDAVYARVHALNPRINAFCTLTEERPATRRGKPKPRS